MPKVSTKDNKKADKSKKAKKDPLKPKRALSAYMFFVQDYRERVKSENPDASFGDVGRLLGAKWKEMTSPEKKPYEDKAAADKDRSARENAVYNSNKKKAKAQV
jgi:hypothetical protein